MNRLGELPTSALGDSVPEPLGFNAFGPEWRAYTEETGTEDRAPQGCDSSAASSAAMTNGRLPQAALNSKIDCAGEIFTQNY